MPIFLLRRSISPDIMVMIPRPPICKRSRMTICPTNKNTDRLGRGEAGYCYAGGHALRAFRFGGMMPFYSALRKIPPSAVCGPHRLCRRCANSYPTNKNTDRLGRYFYLVGEAGFGPAKSVTTDLQSAPFGRSGIPPGAGERSRTINLLITNQLLCH